jgi:hypothetical protein
MGFPDCFTLNMSRGTFKVIAKLISINHDNDSSSYMKGQYRYIPANIITMVEKDSTHFEEMDYRNIEVLHDALIEASHLNCPNNHDDNGQNIEYNNCLDKQGLYIITITGNTTYVVDPSENEHMERFLAGTDDPIYDLVHELRYNPRIRLGEDVQEAESHFKKHKTE